jgi:hypothetical protein
MTEEKIETKLCKCGCGEEVFGKGEFRQGHFGKWKSKQTEVESDKKEELKKQYLNIQDVQSIERIENMVAWFDDGKGNKISKVPDLIGLLVNEERNESIPTLLILAADGTFVPPFLMAGFIGMFPEDQIFPEEPKLEMEPKISPSISTQEEEIELQAKDGVQAQSVSPSILEDQPKKKGFLGGVFKKKKTEPEQPKEISRETKDLLNQLTNAKT